MTPIHSCELDVSRAHKNGWLAWIKPALWPSFFAWKSRLPSPSCLIAQLWYWLKHVMHNGWLCRTGRWGLPILVNLLQLMGSNCPHLRVYCHGNKFIVHLRWSDLKTGFSSCVGGRGMCIYLSSSQLFGFPSFKTSAKYSIYGVILGMEGKTTLEADTHTS